MTRRPNVHDDLACVHCGTKLKRYGEPGSPSTFYGTACNCCELPIGLVIDKIEGPGKFTVKIEEPRW